jgi:uncharacterized damage-inducible protein DinB
VSTTTMGSTHRIENFSLAPAADGSNTKLTTGSGDARQIGKMIKELQPIADQLAASRTQLFHAIEGLSDELLRVPFPGRDWSIKDTLAHLAANEALMTELAEGIATGKHTHLPNDFDNERFNAESVAARRDHSVRQVLEELVRSRQRLFKFLGDVKSNQLLRRGTHPLQGELTLREFLVVMYAHGVTHTREIEEQVRRLKAKEMNSNRTEENHAK